MVSSMESNSEAREELREMERAEVSPYVDYPPTAWWYPPAMGLFAGAFLMSLALIVGRNWLGFVALGSLLVIEGIAISCYQRYHGAMPSSLRNPPLEFRPLFRRFFAGYLGIVVIAAALWILIAPWVAAIVTIVLVTVALMVYEKAYAAKAAQTKARLDQLA